MFIYLRIASGVLVLNARAYVLFLEIHLLLVVYLILKLIFGILNYIINLFL